MKRGFRLLRAVLATRAFKITTLAMGCLAFDRTIKRFSPALSFQCWGTPNIQHKIQSLFENALLIRNSQGHIVGHAYCIAPDLFVTASPQVFDSDSKQSKSQYDCFKSNCKSPLRSTTLGKYQNMTFMIIKDSGVTPIPEGEAKLFEEVILINKKLYPEVKTGYLVHRESGFAFVNQNSVPGALAVRDGNAIGLVSKVGTKQFNDYSLVVSWKSLKHLAKRLENNQLVPFLGLSVKNKDNDKGAFVMRISTDSPFGRFLHLGDVIKRINGEQVIDTKDVLRLIAFSSKQIEFAVDYEGKERTFTMQL